MSGKHSRAAKAERYRDHCNSLSQSHLDRAMALSRLLCDFTVVREVKAALSERRICDLDAIFAKYENENYMMQFSIDMIDLNDPSTWAETPLDVPNNNNNNNEDQILTKNCDDCHELKVNSVDIEHHVSSNVEAAEDNSGEHPLVETIEDIVSSNNVESEDSTLDSPSSEVLQKPAIIISASRDSVLLDRCDPSNCVTCDVGHLTSIPSCDVILYSGPGCGKTFFLKTIPQTFKGLFYDTDHLINQIPYNSIVLTNQWHLLRYGHIKVVHLPSEKMWIKRCMTKCNNVQRQWYLDLVAGIPPDALIVKSNRFLSEIVKWK